MTGFDRLCVVSAVAPGRVRVRKLLEVLETIDVPYEVWWWDRGESDGEAGDFRSAAYSRVLYTTDDFAGRSTVGKAWAYAGWIANVVMSARGRASEWGFWCVGFDASLAVTLACLLTPGRSLPFVFDNADNISLTYDWGVVAPLVRRIERYIATRASCHVLPGESRWQGPDDNLKVVYNTPSSSMLNSARRIAQRRGYERGKRLTLYVNGWLQRTRGLDTLGDAIGSLEGRVDVVMAGTLVGRDAEKLAAHPGVRYVGRLDPEEALALYWSTHLVLTFYDPIRTINRLAEPNKWGDCIATNTPFVVNSEVETAEAYLERGACFAVPYHDSDVLAEMLFELDENRDRWREAQVALRSLSQQPWDESVAELLSELGARGGRA